MEDHQSKLTEPEHLGIEMDVLEDKNCSTRQDVPFPGSARRLSTKSQRPREEVDGYQVVRNAQSIQDKYKRASYDSDITSGTYDLPINCSPETSASGKCIAQEESNQFFHRPILDTQVGGEDSIATEDDRHFLERRELQFKRCSDQDSRQFHSTRGESTQVFHRDVLGSQFVRVGNKHDVETKTDESYFLAQYESQFKRLSEPDARRHPTRPGSTESFVPLGKCKSNRGAKLHHTNPGKSIGVDGEYWRKIFLNGDDVKSEESSLEQKVTEAKRQWYRPRKIRPNYFRSPPSTNLEFWFTLLATIMTIICVVLIVLLWEYLPSLSS